MKIQYHSGLQNRKKFPNDAIDPMQPVPNWSNEVQMERGLL